MSCSSSSAEYIRRVGGITNDEIDDFFNFYSTSKHFGKIARWTLDKTVET